MTRWYPNFNIAIHRQVQETFRRVLDFVYELRDQLGPMALYASSTEQLTIGITRTYVPGCQLNLGRTGYRLVTGVYSIIVDGDGGKLFTGSLRVSAEQMVPQALLNAANTTTASIVQQWLILTTTAGTEIGLEVVKEDTASGDSTAEKHHCTISATWQGRAT